MGRRGSFGNSFRFASAGVLYALRTQPNMRFHFFIAGGVLVFALLLGLKAGDFVLIFFAVEMVLVAEMFNTAVEATVDLFSPGRHRLAKTAKDAAAGAVLLAAVNSVIVGSLVFYPYLVALGKRLWGG